MRQTRNRDDPLRPVVKSARFSSLFHYNLLLVAFGLGGISVAGLRLPFGRTPGGSWLWGLLLISALLGGLALARLEAAIREMQPPPRFPSPGRPTRRRAGAVCILIALLVVGMVVFRLWPDYRQWRGTFVPWVAALLLMVAGGHLLGTVGRPAGTAERAAASPGSGLATLQIPRWLEFFWQPPGFEEVPVPPRALIPPETLRTRRR